MFKKPIFIEEQLNSKEYGVVDQNVVLMSNEAKKKKLSLFIKLLEIIVPKYT